MESNHAYIEFDGKYLLTLDNNYLRPPRSAKAYLHCHPWLEISLVKTGTGEYIVDDKVYDIREGDIFLFNNIEKHAIGIYPPNEMVNMVIHFEPRLIWNMSDSTFDYRYLKIFFDRNDNFENRLDRNNPATEEIKRLLLEIEDEFRKRLPEYELMIKVKLLNILVALIRHYGYTEKKNKTPSKIKKDLLAMNRVIDYIDDHLCEDIMLEDLASIAYMNPSYFSTLFKKYNGISPIEYISKRRISRAIEYLKASDKTVLEIASLCGFNNPTNFYKTFKKLTGKTPSDFR
ncbi:MAG: AraC family transcriptional regulator [Xylanivirga thermophila]|jgi:AraC-like DNA-binding protein|uniref:AraC family transcriptional regulator n=1 Tax=Xylanivirga thermophila TaxID=2496273 RepID=UPI00101B81EE|nr:AraC family transcriptional regulator [Xylanivirga thermophila]